MKKLKFIFLLSWAILIQCALFAQDYIVSLKGAKINIPENNYLVTQVIDARIEKSCHGYIFGDYPSSRRQVKIEGGIEASLLSVLKSGSNSSVGKNPVIIKINKLSVFEDGYSVMGKSYVYAEMQINMDFYTILNDTIFHQFNAGRYVKFIHVDIYHGISPKGQIDDQIVKITELCYSEFLQRMRLNLGHQQVVSQQQLQENSLNQEQLAKSRSNNYKNGIYHSFNDFRDNILDTLTIISQKSIDTWAYNLGCKIFKFEDSNIKPINIWGVEYNRITYIQIDAVFIPIKVTPTAYVIKNLASFYQNGRLMEAGAEMGLLGLIAASKKVYDQDKSYNSDYLEKQFIIDMSTGMPVPMEETDSRKFESKLIFYTDKYDGENLDLSINGKKVCSFMPNSYFTIKVTLDENPLNICLKSDSDEYCETISVEIFNTMYFEAIINKKGMVSLFEKKSHAMQSSINYLIENGKMVKIEQETE